MATYMAEQTMERFEHRPMQENSSIRLLKLLPGCDGKNLKCQIFEIQNASEVSFEALSYTWGDPETPEIIHVCAPADIDRTLGYISITQNLFKALLRLRSEHTPRTIWIDMLCINQHDLQEKAHQVARMGQVYCEADRVIVWLGEDQFYPRTRALLTQDGRDRWPLTLPEVDLGELVTIPWFSRVWAVQEYVLPRHVFFQLGELFIPAKHLETVVKRTGIYLNEDKKLHDQWKNIIRLFEYRNLVQHRGSSAANSQLTLTRTFLDLTRHRLCKDSRDRIYGILGIFENAKIAPDYTIPPRQVYREFVSKLLVAGDFSILHECCIGITDVEDQSYVPFFGQSRSKSTYIPFADLLDATYSAGLHRPPMVNLNDDRSISVEGFSIDTVQNKLDFTEECNIELEPGGLVMQSAPGTANIPLRGTWGAIYQTILNQFIGDPEEHLRWRKDFEINRLSPQFSKAPYTHNSLFEMLVRAIRTDLNADYDWLSSTGQIRTDSHLRRSRRDILQERSLFWTTAGFVGLGTCHLRPGDKVVVFNGDTTPFLLREEDYANRGKGVYKIVSDCYLCGWMYGPYPDRTVARDPSLRKSIAEKLKSRKQEVRSVATPRTFTIS